MTTERDAAPIVDGALACVTVSYRSGEALTDLIDSIEHSTVLPASTVIVNNAPDDPVHITSENASIRVIEAGRNLGYGSAVNLGVRTLDPEIEWVLITNPDVRLSDIALASLLKTARSMPSAGAWGPKIRDSRNKVYPSARELPSLRTGIGHALFANAWRRNPWTRRYRGENRPSGTSWRETGWLSGSCLLVRRSAFEAIGGFDESYFMYFEDVDLGRRLNQAGWQNVYAPSATVCSHRCSLNSNVCQHNARCASQERISVFGSQIPRLVPVAATGRAASRTRAPLSSDPSRLEGER